MCFGAARYKFSTNHGLVSWQGLNSSPQKICWRTFWQYGDAGGLQRRRRWAFHRRLNQRLPDPEKLESQDEFKKMIISSFIFHVTWKMKQLDSKRNSWKTSHKAKNDHLHNDWIPFPQKKQFAPKNHGFFPSSEYPFFHWVHHFPGEICIVDECHIAKLHRCSHCSKTGWYGVSTASICLLRYHGLNPWGCRLPGYQECHPCGLVVLSSIVFLGEGRCSKKNMKHQGVVEMRNRARSTEAFWVEVVCAHLPDQFGKLLSLWKTRICYRLPNWILVYFLLLEFSPHTTAGGGFKHA